MKYLDFIKGNEGFQYSINIQYDLMNPLKINSYIPTNNSVELLKEYLLNCLIDNREKTTVLIGPYGKGKSHLLLILLGIMCGDSTVKEIDSLISRIDIVDKECGSIAHSVLENKKYLPVVLNFNYGDLGQSFLIGINQALKSKEIQDILPDTYFDSAIKVIDNWKLYNDTIEKVSDLVNKNLGIDIDEFKERLNSFNKETYECFKVVFKEITSGIEFNPMTNTDIVKLYEEVNHILRDKYNYDGIIIVFDEFSKFIESSSSMNNSMELKILQDFAELSSRSKTPQMHLVCITHKTINEYISKIPQEKIDGWRAIEGRFKEVFFNSTSQQNYELISNAINKDMNIVESIIDKFNDNLNKHYLSGSKLFDYDEEAYNERIVKGCFPLSPYTTFALPIISEKVAQNERTLFTYLSKDEANSLINLINQDSEACDIVTLDKLYDYFEPLFKKETFNESIYNIWIKVDTALRIVYSELEKRIIKALGVIYIVNDFAQLAPNEDNIRNALNIERDIFKDTVKNLKNTNILVLRKSNEILDFIPLSSVDINQKISSVLEAKFKEPNYTQVLMELINLKYILPKRYNDEYKMTRFFRRTFMTTNELFAYSKSEALLEDYVADGLVVDLVYFNNKELIEIENWRNKINDSRIVLVIPKQPNKIKEDISEYKAISYLKSDKEFLSQDAAIESQINILYEDVVDKIVDYINKNYDLGNGLCNIYIENKSYTDLKPNVISMEFSRICKYNFGKAPIINNELINKNEISSQIKKARDVIVTAVLDDTYKQFDYSTNSSESTLFRATLSMKGLLESEKNYSDDIKLIIKTIRKFIVEACEKELNFSELYNKLMSNSNEIGMRRGVLPIYLGFVLKDYKEELIIYLKYGRKKKEVILDTSVINNININPKDYLIKVDELTEEKEEYLNNLLSLFNEYMPKLSKNRYVDIINAMKAWLQSLSLYAQNHNINLQDGKELEDSIKNFRNALIKFDINYRQFIFEDLCKIFNTDSYSSTIEKVSCIKVYLDSFDKAATKYLIVKTNEIIDKGYTGSLTGNLSKWYLGLNEHQKTHLFNTDTNEFIRLSQTIGNNDKEAINKLALNFTGLSLADWKDKTIKQYILQLKNTIREIEEFELAIDKNDGLGTVKIVLNSDKSIIEKSFDKVEISPIGETLKNVIEESIDEYSESIDDNEKRNILMNIISKYI